MSYILDALKKIEHEKNSKRLDGRISIAGDLFREGKHPLVRTFSWKNVALIAVVSLVTGAGTWFVLQGSNKKNMPVIDAVTFPVATPLTAPAIPQRSPVLRPVLVPASPAPAPAVPVANNGTVPVEDDEYSPSRVSRAKKQMMTTKAITPKQSIQAMQAPADIKLSGIAWQDEHAARRAVINGFLLKEGAIVSGAKITDIQADKVSFSSAAGLFEIKLDAVLPAEVK